LKIHRQRAKIAVGLAERTKAIECSLERADNGLDPLFAPLLIRDTTGTIAFSVGT
jgi:hypothetical protein